MPWRKLPRDWYRRRQEVLARHHVDSPLIDKLATYNAERYRGIMHTPEWQAEMAELQRRFDASMAEVHEAIWRRP